MTVALILAGIIVLALFLKCLARVRADAVAAEQAAAERRTKAMLRAQENEAKRRAASAALLDPQLDPKPLPALTPSRSVPRDDRGRFSHRSEKEEAMNMEAMSPGYYPSVDPFTWASALDNPPAPSCDTTPDFSGGGGDFGGGGSSGEW